jgi:hypothetical protein
MKNGLQYTDLKEIVTEYEMAVLKLRSMNSGAMVLEAQTRISELIHILDHSFKTSFKDYKVDFDECMNKKVNI